MLFFASRGFRAVAFDRRGFGRSSQPWAGYGYDTFAEDIAELIEHLELRDLTLVGFSMGGGDIVRYIARHGSSRASKLALVSAVTPLFGKTSGHDGVDKAVFDGIKAGLVKDRPQFLDDFSPIFYGASHGTKVSSGVAASRLGATDGSMCELHCPLCTDGRTRGLRGRRCLRRSYGGRPRLGPSPHGVSGSATNVVDPNSIGAAAGLDPPGDI